MTATLLNHHTEGPTSASPLLLGPSLGTSSALWDKVAPELSVTHRVVRWDLPGHGGSPAGLIGPGATVADLAALVLALADSLGIERFAYAGCRWAVRSACTAVHHPERISSLAVVCSSAHFNGAKPWEERAARVRDEGLDWLVESADARWFTPGFTVPRLVRDQGTPIPGRMPPAATRSPPSTCGTGWRRSPRRPCWSPAGRTRRPRPRICGRSPTRCRAPRSWRSRAPRT